MAPSTRAERRPTPERVPSREPDRYTPDRSMPQRRDDYTPLREDREEPRRIERLPGDPDKNP